MKKIFLIALLCCSCLVNDEVDVSKYPMLTTAEKLSKIYSTPMDTSGTSETISLTKYYDFSVELEYTYDSLESEDHIPFHYTISINKDLSSSSALQSYFITKKALEIGSNAFEQSTKEINDVELPGEQNYYATRFYEGEEIGILFIMKEENIVYSVYTTGLIFDDHSFLLDAILPDLKTLSQFGSNS